MVQNLIQRALKNSVTANDTVRCRKWMFEMPPSIFECQVCKSKKRVLTSKVMLKNPLKKGGLTRVKQVTTSSGAARCRNWKVEISIFDGQVRKRVKNRMQTRSKANDKQHLALRLEVKEQSRWRQTEGTLSNPL